MIEPFDLRGAQIIFFADGKKPETRINSEIRAIASVKLGKGISKNKGDPILANEVEGLDKIKLTDEENPDCGHATPIRIGNTWVIAFDFRYNKGLAQEHINVAKQFYESAEFAFTHKNRSSLDNLSSAAELVAKTVLLLIPDQKFMKKTTHGGIQLRFNKFADLGNVEPKCREALNKLIGLRARARYLQGDVSISDEEIQGLLENVKKMIADASERIQLNDKPIAYHFRLGKEHNESKT